MGQGQASYTVGQAAKAAGISARAVRLYESKGMVQAAHRLPSGYRVFSDDDVATLTFVRQGRSLGLSLEAIAEVLEASAAGPPCERTRALFEQRLTEIDSAINDLQQLRSTIVEAQRTTTTGARCGVIENARG